MLQNQLPQYASKWLSSVFHTMHRYQFLFATAELKKIGARLEKQQSWQPLSLRWRHPAALWAPKFFFTFIYLFISFASKLTRSAVTLARTSVGPFFLAAVVHCTPIQPFSFPIGCICYCSLLLTPWGGPVVRLLVSQHKIPGSIPETSLYPVFFLGASPLRFFLVRRMDLCRS